MPRCTRPARTFLPLALVLLLLSPTLGQASPLPADPVAAFATCQTVYGTLHAYHSVFGPPEESAMFELRSRAAWKALRALVEHNEAVLEHIDVAEERLAFLPGGAWRHIRAHFTQYDAACTALLAPRYNTDAPQAPRR